MCLFVCVGVCVCGGGWGVCGVCVCVCVFCSIFPQFLLYLFSSFLSLFFFFFFFLFFDLFYFWDLGHHDFLSFEYLIFSSRLWVIYAFKTTVSFR